MAAPDPKQAIMENLNSFQRIQVLTQIHPGVDHTIKLATLHFLKERSISHYQLHIVQYENQSGEQWYGTYLVKQKADHWQCQEVGGNKVEDRFAMTESERIQYVNQPFVRLSGGIINAETIFWANGDVLDNGFQVAKIRLKSDNGHMLTDTVQDGFVLFLTDQQIQIPIEVELDNHLDQIVGKNLWFEH